MGFASKTPNIPMINLGSLDLALRARALVLDVLPPDVLETVDGTDIGYGWTRGYQGAIAVISVYARWVNLGLTNGMELPDPGGLLLGTGKRHRHVRVSTAADLDQPALRQLLQASVMANPRPDERQQTTPVP